MKSNEAVAKGYLDEVGARMKQKRVTVKSEVRFSKATEDSAGEEISKVIEDNGAQEIIKFANEIHADVVAVSTHMRSYDGRWLFSNVAERLLYKGNTPLLVVAAPAVGLEYLLRKDLRWESDRSVCDSICIKQW